MKKVFYRFPFFCCLLAIVVYSAFPQVGMKKLGQSTMNFLLVSPSAKASAMGEAFSSVGTGSEAIFFNPAGLTEMSRTVETNIGITKWIADINYLSGCVAVGLGDYGTIGFHFLTVDYGTIIGTSLLTGAEAASGNFPLGYKETGPVNNVGAYSVGVTYARFINPQFSIGGTFKIAGQNLGENYFSNGVHKENKAYKVVFDGGVRFKTGFKSFCFGMAMRNFSSDVQRELIPEQLPMNFVLGGTIDLFDFILSEHSSGTGLVTSVDFVHYNNYSERVKIGIEHRMLNILALRVGYMTNNDVLSWSGGIGFRTDISGYELEANYSYSQAEIFSGISRISIGFAF